MSHGYSHAQLAHFSKNTDYCCCTPTVFCVYCAGQNKSPRTWPEEKPPPPPKGPMNDKELQAKLLKKLTKLRRLVDAVGETKLRRAVDQRLTEAFNLLQSETPHP